MVDVDDVLEWSERVATIVGNLISILLIVQMVGDLLGVIIFEVLRTAVARPWVVPVELIRQYYWLWYSMQFMLLVVMLADQVYTMRYMQVHKEPPPPEYVRWVSLVIFMLSFWLALVLRYMTFFIICALSAISFSYTMFVRRES